MFLINITTDILYIFSWNNNRPRRTEAPVSDDWRCINYQLYKQLESPVQIINTHDQGTNSLNVASLSNLVFSLILGV